MSDARLRKWDIINNWKTDADIIDYMQVVQEDGLPELVAISLVDIARAKGVLDTSGNAPRGESPLEKAIDAAYRRHSKTAPTEIQMSEAELPKRDVINNWKTGEHITDYLQVLLENGLPEPIATGLLDIAQAKGLLVTTGEVARGENPLEKAIASSYERHSRPSIIPAKMLIT